MPAKLTRPQYIMLQEKFQLTQERFKPKREIGSLSQYDVKKTGDLPLKRETWQLCALGMALHPFTLLIVLYFFRV